MPRYRLVFPTPDDMALENTPTAHIDSGETVYEVGAEIHHDGKRWRVSQAPLEQPESGEEADLMLWPAE
ncbi:MAG TPA: hypothetical protein VGM80_00480 [Gaiellaceae bacterium]|jgi:hypothetical protein